jgi:hypothetical protein
MIGKGVFVIAHYSVFPATWASKIGADTVRPKEASVAQSDGGTNLMDSGREN